jgi:hypothetical protein
MAVSKQNFYSTYGKESLTIMINTGDLYFNAFASQEGHGILQVPTSLQGAREVGGMHNKYALNLAGPEPKISCMEDQRLKPRP